MSNDDGLIDTIDPFTRDATNGAQALVTPGRELLWDFDANQDGNLPGACGLWWRFDWRDDQWVHGL